jgi:predicted small secreted protein
VLGSGTLLTYFGVFLANLAPKRPMAWNLELGHVQAADESITINRDKHMKRLLFAFFAAVLLTVSVTGCNTTRGAGKDIEKAGQGIQDAVD